MVGNGNPMGVPAQIPKYIFRAAEGPFAVDDPFVPEQSTDKRAKGFWIGKVLQFAVELDLVFCDGVLQSLSELGTKHILQHLFGQEEVVPWIHANPTLMIEGQTACGNDAVNVRMMLHFLSPGMEHTEEADFSAQTLGSAGDLDQSFSAQTQQQSVNELFVLKRELCQETRHRKNDVGIGDGKKFLLASLNPAQAGVGLAFRAMPIAA